MSHRLRLWRRGGRRKGCRWQWLGLKEVLSLFSVTKLSAWHLERHCLALICNCHLQVYLQAPPGRFCQEWWMLSSWGGLSSLPWHQKLFLVSTHCHARRCHQETNSGFCSTGPFWRREWIPEGRVSINAQGSCSGWSSHCVFLTSTLGVLSKGICEWGGKTGLF